jgi:hypothetical protein
MMDETIENKKLKRNAIDMSCIFYKMRDFLAIEIFCAMSFIVLQISRIWRKKLIRTSTTPMLNGLGIAHAQCRFASRGILEVPVARLGSQAGGQEPGQACRTQVPVANAWLRSDDC